MRIRSTVLQCVCLAACGSLAFAQRPIPELEQAALSSHTAWYAIASTLDVRVARMLPCDAAATAAIEEVSKASTGRLVALSAYLAGASEQAAKDLAAARTQLAAAEARLADPSFIGKAPPAVVDGAERRAKELRDEITRLEEEGG
mgnify:CR=1 FL=1